MTSPNPAILWFRRDLRLSDNPALTQAVQSGKPVICVYIDETDMARPLGGASQWWLHHSLKSLSENLEAVGTALHIFRGSAADILSAIIRQCGADQLFWNRRYTQDGIERDSQIKTAFKDQGIKTESFKANLLTEPWEIQTGGGGYYKVFSPYWRAVLKTFEPLPALPSPKTITSFAGPLQDTLPLDALGLLPSTPDWGAKMDPFWTPGSAGAQQALDRFLDGPVETYKADRDRPDLSGTSRLAPHLAFGEISPRQIWHAVKSRTENGAKFLSEIGWREFSYVLLFHNPEFATKNFKPYFDAFPWYDNPDRLTRWQIGQTGYPIVDAGMRELWQTGWQHNRVRMIAASFLIKHLRIDWREGERWFWDCLVDADPGNNPAGWQWVAGSGADASPYFRIFNPITQGLKFDPNGDYVRRFVPELSKLPTQFIHEPWTAPGQVLREAGITLGETYPEPIVDHRTAREEALAAYNAIKVG